MLGLSQSTSGCQPREEHSGQRTAGDRPLVGAHAGCGALAVWTCRGRSQATAGPEGQNRDFTQSAAKPIRELNSRVTPSDT